MKTLILGGVKSGKSRLAQTLAADTGLPVSIVATATADDDEMRARIARHRADRPAHWVVVEEPLALAHRLAELDSPTQCVIVDCLTLWMSNLLLGQDDDCLPRELDDFLIAVKRFQGRLFIVSNETSMGVVPMGELSRRYCDEIGLLHQQVAAICDSVKLTVAGLPLTLKG